MSQVGTSASNVCHFTQKRFTEKSDTVKGMSRIADYLNLKLNMETMIFFLQMNYLSNFTFFKNMVGQPHKFDLF